MNSFAGRTAIVTGASSGIGRAVAERLAGAGASLVLVAAPQDADALDRVTEDLRARGAQASALAADVGDEATAEKAVRIAVRDHGRLDMLVNNAGITAFDEVFDAPVAQFDHIMRVNVRGMYLMAIEAARAMSTAPAPSIVCTASTAAWMGEEHQVHYLVSKGAVAQLIRALAVDLAPYGIRVNGVAPGSVLTPVVQEIVARDDEWAKYRVHIPLDRPAEPEEIAAPIAFLLSDEASYITGSTLTVDGGVTAGFRMSDWDAVPKGPAPRPRRRPTDREDGLA